MDASSSDAGCLAYARTSSRPLTPEEDVVEDPDEDDGIDELMPADLWFRRPSSAGETGRRGPALRTATLSGGLRHDA